MSLQAKECQKTVYIEVASIGFITDLPWLDCEEEEPFDSGNTWKTSEGEYSIYKLVRGVPYNIDPVEGIEFFWFRGGCAGRDICIDDNNRSSIPNGDRIMVPNVNVCYRNNSVWMNFCTQCQDCNDSATAIKGRWWKYEEYFEENDLGENDSAPTALQMNLTYQMIVPCRWQTNYGCDNGEDNGG